MHPINDYRACLIESLGMGFCIKSCCGSRIYTIEGKRLTDFLSQYGALPFGHNPSFAIQALKRHLQREAPVFTQPVFQTGCEQFARRLLEVMGGCYLRCVFTNSGAEAVEAAIKLARLKTGRRRILSVRNSFHGKTATALACHGTLRHSAKILADDRHHAITLNNREQLEAELSSGDYAALIVEPILGEGGMYPVDYSWLQLARQCCDQSSTLLIFDEVQTGLGRTGYFSVAQEYGIYPDILLLAKALGAGLIPCGALLV